MSEREDMVKRMVAWLEARENVTDVIESLEAAEPPARGYYRHITFSALLFDAAVNIWGSHRIDMHDSSMLEDRWINLHSEAEFYDHCRSLKL